MALAVGFLALPFLSAPGRYVFDTRDTLWMQPTAYLTRGLALWQPTPYLGNQDGILLPMAGVVWLLRTLGLSAWVTERLWHGFLLLVTTGSTIMLVDAFRGRRTLIAPLSAGLAYTLTPYVIGYGLPFTPVFLPYVLMPLLLLVVLKGLGRRGPLWPALFGLVTFFMGGGNGAPQIYALLTAFTLAAWLVFVEHGVTLRRGAAFAVWSLAFFVGLNAYWLVLFNSPEVFNALKFSEQPDSINITSSAGEALRGLGFWAFYGGSQFGPWIAPVREYITSLWLVMTGLAIPIGAFISAWLVTWRFRLYVLLLVTLAVFVSVGIFPVPSPSPFGHFLLYAYGHIPGVEGLRTTYKVTGDVNLGVAILAGIGLEALWTNLSGRRRVVLRLGVLSLVVAIIGANGYPLFTGRLYNIQRSTSGLPAYWQDALKELDRRDTAYRAFLAPSTYWTTYRWGSIKNSVLAADPKLNAVYPLRLPIDQRYGSNLVAATEEPYLEGTSAKGTAQLLRYLGVRDVVLQNDIDWRRSRTARPSELVSLRGDPDLQPALRFGRPGENVTDRSDGSEQAAAERLLSPVEVLSVRDPIPMVRAEQPVPIVLSGDGFGVANAARQGLLEPRVPLLYSGGLTTKELEALLSEGSPSFIVTDTNRRRVWYFSSPRSPFSYTLQHGQTIADKPTGYLLFNDRPSTQTAALYPGLRTITASGYGSVFGTSPQYRPANAFDGDPKTWWLVGSGKTPEGAWIQATLAHPILLSSISVAQPDAWWLREVRTIRVSFSDGSSIDAQVARGRRATIVFPQRRTSWVRITLTSTGASPLPSRLAGTALSEVGLPGIHPAPTIQVPNDLFKTASRAPQTMSRLATAPFIYLFQRARSYYPGGPDEEVDIARRFEVAGAHSFALSGSARLNVAATDDQLDQALLGPRFTVVQSSSRLYGSPLLRGSAALDGDPSTQWVPRGTIGERLMIRFPAHPINRVVVDTAVGRGRLQITRVRAVFSDGTSVFGTPSDPSSGVITMTFPVRSVSSITLFVDRVFARSSHTPRLIGISEVHIPGVHPLPITSITPLPCSRGQASLDGHPLPIRPVGTVGDFLAGKELPLTTCDGLPVELDSGTHDLAVGGGLQPDVIMLRSGVVRPFEDSESLPDVRATHNAGGQYRIQVSGAKGPYYLVLGQNWDTEWGASIQGKDLGPPSLLDGYSAGWRVDRAGSYLITVRYRKQAAYELALLVSAVTLFVCVGLMAWSLLRRRRD